MMDYKMYTIQETAKILRTSRQYIYDLIYTGRLRAVRLSERRFRVCEQALQDFVREEEEKMAEM